MQTTQTINATDLARNTRQILDRVVMAGEHVAIERNHVVIAQITPAQATMCAAQALAGLDSFRLTAQQADAWLRSSRPDATPGAGDAEAVRDPWA